MHNPYQKKSISDLIVNAILSVLLVINLLPVNIGARIVADDFETSDNEFSDVLNTEENDGEKEEQEPGNEKPETGDVLVLKEGNKDGETDPKENDETGDVSNSKAGGETLLKGASAESTRSVDQLPTAIEGLVYNEVAQQLINPGSIQGGSYEYRIGSEGNFLSEVPTATKAGDYSVYYRVQGTEEETEIKVSIAKRILTIIAPAFKELVYNGQNQVLVTAGECKDQNDNVFKDAKFYYYASRRSNEPSINSDRWTTDLPQYSNAGTRRYVWWKCVIEDTVNNSVAGSCNTVVSLGSTTIAKTTVTPSVTLASGLTYTGESLELISATSCDHQIGTFFYYVSSSNTGPGRTPSNNNNYGWSTSIPQETNAGDYYIWWYYRVNQLQYQTNYDITNVNKIVYLGNVSIANADITISNTEQVFDYDGNPHGEAIGVTTVKNQPATVLYSLSDEEGTYSETIPQVTIVSADGYTFYYKVTAPNHNDKKGELRIKIKKAPSEVSLAPTAKDLTYTGNDQELINPGTAVGGTMVYSLTEDGIYTTDIPVGRIAADQDDTYTVWYRVNGDANHENSGSGSVDVQIKRKPVELTWSANRFEYCGETKVPVYEISGEIAGDPCSASVKYYAGNNEVHPINAGNYVAKVSFQNPNYLLPNNAEYAFEITQKPVTISGITANNKVYDGNTGATLKYDSVIFSGIVEDDEGSLSVEATGTFNSENVGKQKVWLSNFVLSGDAANNYVINETESQEYTEATIRNADMRSEVTVSGYEGIYDGEYHSVTFEIPEDAEIEFTRKNGNQIIPTPSCVDAGEKTFTFTVYKPNYNDVTGDVTIAISPADIQISNTTQVYNYDGNPHGEAIGVTTVKNQPATVLYSLSGEEGTYSETAPQVTDANENGYTLYYKVTAPNHNAVEDVYHITINKADASVSKAPAAVDNLVYSGEAQALITAGTPVGGVMKYKLEGEEEYSVNIPTAEHVLYDATNNQVLSYRVFYMVEGDDNHNDCTGDDQYVDVTINPKELTLNWSTDDLVYDGTMQVPDLTITGEISGEEYNASVLYTDNDNQPIEEPTNAGTYTATVVISNHDYVLPENNTCVFEILKAEPDFTITTTDWVYGDEPVALEFEDLHGAEVTSIEYKKEGAEDEKYSQTVPTDANVYDVKVTVSETDNYKSGAKYAKVEITKAEISVKANNVSLTYGQNPKTVFGSNLENIGVTYSGLKYEEEAEDVIISGTLNYSCTYKQYNDVGNFDIVLTGNLKANNYEFTYENGLLTVEQLTLKFKWSKPTLYWITDYYTYGLPKRVEATVTNAVNGDSISVSAYLNNNKTDAGKYTAKVTGIKKSSIFASDKTKNYKIDDNEPTTSYEWEIKKASNSLGVRTRLTDSIKFSTETVDRTVDAVTSVDGDVVYSINSVQNAAKEDCLAYFSVTSNNKLRIAGSTPVDVYTIRMTASTEGDKNHNSASAVFTLTLTIAKIDGFISLSTDSLTLKHPTSSTVTVTSNTSGGEILVSRDRGTLDFLQDDNATFVIEGSTITVIPKGYDSLLTRTQKYTVKSAETNDYAESNTVTLSVTVEKGDITVTATPLNGIYNGNEQYAMIKTDLEGAKIEYGIKKHLIVDYIDYETITSNAEKGKEYNLLPGYTDHTDSQQIIYYRVSKTGYNDLEGQTTLYIGKADPDFILPEATNPVYNTELQNLIIPGQTEDGEFLYSLTPEDKDSWTGQVPQAIYPDNYTVYYRLVGDHNHSNKSGSVEATIEPKTYTVRFNDGEGNTTTQTLTCDKFVFDDPESLDESTFTKENFDLMGWATSEGSLEIVYENCQILNENLCNLETEIVDLYAVWYKDASSVEPSGTYGSIKVINAADIGVDANGIAYNGSDDTIIIVTDTGFVVLPPKTCENITKYESNTVKVCSDLYTHIPGLDFSQKNVVYLKISSSVSTDDSDLLKSYARKNGYDDIKPAMMFEAKMFVNGTEIHNFSGRIQIEMDATDIINALPVLSPNYNRLFRLLHLMNDNSIEEVGDFALDQSNKRITYSIGSLSPFAVVFKDVRKRTDSTPYQLPTTGIKNTNNPFGALLLSGIVIYAVGSIYLSLKRKKEDDDIDDLK